MTVVRYLANPDVGGFSKEIIKDFEAKNSDIRVEMVEGPSATNTREDMYAASFMAKEETYDLVYMDVAWLPKFAAQGWLSPLDDLFAKEDQDEFLPGDIAGSRYQGRIYRLPIQSDGGMLYYRKDLLAAKGIEPPATWDELVAAAKKIQSPPELCGLVFQGKQYEGLVCVF
ncbi:MAG: extracellular solute-binding protein, partial [Elusimicrobiota bacterium]